MHWRMTNILLRLPWRLPQEVKRVEVTCHLMYADFPRACFYTLEVRTWVDYREQYLSLMRALQVVQSAPDGSETQEDNYGITRAIPNYDRGAKS